MTSFISGKLWATFEKNTTVLTQTGMQI